MAATLKDDEIAPWAAGQICPRCGSKGFRVEWRLVPRPKGSYSIAGVQEKVVATETPFIICGLTDGDGCGTEGQGVRP